MIQSEWHVEQHKWYLLLNVGHLLAVVIHSKSAWYIEIIYSIIMLRQLLLKSAQQKFFFVLFEISAAQIIIIYTILKS